MQPVAAPENYKMLFCKMAHVSLNLKDRSFLSNLRTDTWWLYPSMVVFGFTAFVIYSTWAAFQGDFYWYAGAVPGHGYGGYLSPMYSPPLFWMEGATRGVPQEEAWFGVWHAWWPQFIKFSPAFFIVGFPLAFRFTCYYYRKAYYRAFAGSPPGCAVGAIPQKPYKGETGLMIFQNLHRYAMYFAVIFVFILSYDGVMAFWRDGKFGVGVGSLVLLINPIFIGAYTFGCHSVRHLVGGQMDCMSCSKLRFGAWKQVTRLNTKHEMWAWCSLIWVGFTDVYVRLVSMGIWTDFSTWGN